MTVAVRTHGTQCDACAGDAEAGGEQRPPPHSHLRAPPARGWPLRRGLWLSLAPLGVLIVLLLADTLHRFVGRGPRGDTISGWLSALGNQGTQAEWVAAVRDHLAWSWVAFHATFHRHMHRHEHGYDEYNLPTLENMCSRVHFGLDVGWPLNVTNYPRASMLCSELLALPESLRVHTYGLPRSLTFPGLLSTVAPYFNRGYPVEQYTLKHLSRGPFTEPRMEAANAFLIPVAPYAMRVAAYPGDGLVTVQHRVAAAVDAVKAAYPGQWMGRNGCDQVLVSAHDKGGRVAQLADVALISRGVLVVNTADTHGNEDEWGRYTQGKDVAGVCSFSVSLPMWAAHMETCANSSTSGARDVLASFVGGGLGAVRQGLFQHLEAHPWEELRVLHGHIAPVDYMRLLRTSKFCLHVRGTQVQSPRLIEILLFGCVPVIMADTYDLPLSDVLDWPAFSVRVPQDSPQLLREAILGADYATLARNVCAVRRFFMFHPQPQPGDAFWMTALELHRRLAAAQLRPECRPAEENATGHLAPP